MSTATGPTSLEYAEALLDSRDPAALRAFYAAERRGAHPDRCCAGRWMAHMLAGDFRSAWEESDAIRRRGGPDPHRIWNGEPLDGKRVMLRCLHGLGDAVQFLRYVPHLRAIASTLIVEVPPNLVELAGCIDGVERVISWGTLAPTEPVHWDAQIEVTELPYIFRSEPCDLPIAERYIHLPQARLNRVGRLMRPVNRVPRVGVVWAAGDWNPSRSIPFSLMQELLSIENCEFWNLQGGPPQSDWNQLPPSPRFRDSAQCGDGLLNLACVIAQLDLVITVDTLAAHLAGALGVPGWVLLQYAADWRWMSCGTTSPWYISLRLFRQPSPGDWPSLITDAHKDLEEWTRRYNHPRKIA